MTKTLSLRCNWLLADNILLLIPGVRCLLSPLADVEGSWPLFSVLTGPRPQGDAGQLDTNPSPLLPTERVKPLVLISILLFI